MNQPWETAFKARDDLQAYGDNALGLFALGLKFRIEDLDTVAADSITDGSDDKKCDIVYIDEDEGVAVISQCYVSHKFREAAPANKASDLNTAVAWLIQRPINDLPPRIISAANQLRNGLVANKISTIYIWYIHNLTESVNVKDELLTVEASANAALKTHYPGIATRVHALEIGQSTFNDWYTETLSPILVNDTFYIETTNGYEVTGPDWAAFITSVPARFLHRVFKKYKTRLFSANVRDYLGSRSSDSNINNGIKKTVESDPLNFWVFNNGLTVLVNSYEKPDKNQRGKNQYLRISGISIVNGAQTTGAIGSLKRSPSDEVQVPVRFVQTNNPDLVLNIVQFNNSQNKVTASDFRSTDKIQKRLKNEISTIPNAEYEGGRRGGFGDAIKRRPNLLPSYTVGQSLAALHGDPVTAYNQKTDIWINDRLYSKYFNENTTGAHLIFSYSLLRAVENRKLVLMNKAKKGDDNLTLSEDKQINFLRKRGSIYLLVSAIAACLEVFLGRKIPNLYRIAFGGQVSPNEAQKIWSEIVDVTAPLAAQLEEAINDGLKSIERVNAAIQKFQGLIEVTADANEKKYKSFQSHVITK